MEYHLETMEIYIVTEVHQDGRHYNTVFSNHDEAFDRVQHLLKGYHSYENMGYGRWKAFLKRETAIKVHVTLVYITIDKFTYLPGHDEWVNK